MDSTAWFLPALLLCALPAIDAQAKLEADSAADATDPVTISLLERRITDKTLRVRYEIHNGSGNDIWICESIDLRSRWDIDVYVGQDNETLFVQRRLDVPMHGSRSQPIGRYVRVPHGQTRTETTSFSLPVRYRSALAGRRSSRSPAHATRLVLEIGYHEGDLPSTVFRLLEEAQKSVSEQPVTLPVYGEGLLGMMGGSLEFNAANESVVARSEQVEIPWTDQALPGEKVLRMTVDNLVIPYSEEYAKATPIHLSPCKQVEIRFRRSPLEFFFPYAE